MTDPFDSPKRRVARAKEHIRDLERQIKTFLDQKPYATVVETEADGVTKAHKVKFTKPLPDLLGDIAADAIDNLRSALDQAGYAAAEAGGKIEPKNAYFPFAVTPSDFDGVVKGRCKDLPPDIAALFTSFKAYKGGNDLLWSLNRLSTANKHRLLTSIGIVSGGMYMKRGVLKGPASIPMPTWDREKHEIVFGRTGPGGEFEYEIQLSFAVAFDKVDVVGGQPTIPVLNKLAGEVEGIVLATEAECRCLNLIK